MFDGICPGSFPPMRRIQQSTTKWNSWLWSTRTHQPTEFKVNHLGVYQDIYWRLVNKPEASKEQKNVTMNFSGPGVPEKMQLPSMEIKQKHYNDVIVTTMASQITSLTVVYSTGYSDADQRKYQNSVSLAFVWEIHRDQWIPRTKGQLRGKCFIW